MKNKKSAFICILALAAIFTGCSATEDTGDSNKASENEVTYHGVTNPPSDEYIAHRVTATKITTAVTTVPADKNNSTTTSVITTTTATETETTTTSASTTTANESNTASGDIGFSVLNENSWEQNGSTVYQYELSISNNSTLDLSSWSIQVPLGDSSAELLQGWSGEFSVSGNILTITGVDFNSTLSPASQTSIGFQISSQSPINIADSVLSASGVSIPIS